MIHCLVALTASMCMHLSIIWHSIKSRQYDSIIKSDVRTGFSISQYSAWCHPKYLDLVLRTFNAIWLIHGSPWISQMALNILSTVYTFSLILPTWDLVDGLLTGSPININIMICWRSKKSPKVKAKEKKQKKNVVAARSCQTKNRLLIKYKQTKTENQTHILFKSNFR